MTTSSRHTLNLSAKSRNYSPYVTGSNNEFFSFVVDERDKSIWFFEIDHEGYAMRQIEKYENGKKLKYDLKNIEDEFGGLADQPLDLEEFVKFKITKDEFENQWK